MTVLQTEHWWFEAEFVLFLLLDKSMAEGHPAMTQFNYNSSNWSPSQKLSSQNFFFPFVYSTHPAAEFQTLQSSNLPKILHYNNYLNKKVNTNYPKLTINLWIRAALVVHYLLQLKRRNIFFIPDFCNSS